MAKVIGAKILSLTEQNNSQGLLDMGAYQAWYPGYRPIDSEDIVEEFEKGWCVALRNLPTKPADILELLKNKTIKAALIIGEDPLSMDELPKEIKNGLFGLEFLITADLFFTETAKISGAVLPLCPHAETSGTFTNSERRVQRLEQGMPSRTGFENWEIIAKLADYMGLRFRMNYTNTEDIFEEIRQMVPIYRDVVVNSQEPDGLWNLERFPLKLEKYRFATRAIRLQPVKATIVPTLYFNQIERRFNERMKKLFEASPEKIPEPAQV